jgi:hypothetical protein
VAPNGLRDIVVATDHGLWLGEPRRWYSEHGVLLTCDGIVYWTPWLRRRLHPWAQVAAVQVDVVGRDDVGVAAEVAGAGLNIITQSDLGPTNTLFLRVTVRGVGFADVHDHYALVRWAAALPQGVSETGRLLGRFVAEPALRTSLACREAVIRLLEDRG